MRRLISRDSTIAKDKLARKIEDVMWFSNNVVLRNYGDNCEERLSANSVAVGPCTWHPKGSYASGKFAMHRTLSIIHVPQIISKSPSRHVQPDLELAPSQFPRCIANGFKWWQGKLPFGAIRTWHNTNDGVKKEFLLPVSVCMIHVRRQRVQ
jgi:WD40 repeat protein